jgi:large subunit ribosomal protein L6
LVWCGEMSKIGRKPIGVPQGVTLSIKDGLLIVKGKKGELSLRIPQEISVEVLNGSVVVKRNGDSKKERAIHGLFRQLINNAIIGVTEGFEKKLDIIGTGYKAEVKGDELILYVGFSKPYSMKIPQGLKVSVEQLKTVEKNFRITVQGIDKQLVGQFAADIRRVRPPNVYVGKGIRYVDEVVIKKAGKKAATTTK